MTWTLCTSGQAVGKAGKGINLDISTSGAHLADWNDEAEAVICDIARVNVVSNYNSLTSNGKKILQDLCSSMVAQKLVSYDMSGYPSQRTAETILDVLENSIRRNINFIEDDKIKTYLSAT